MVIDGLFILSFILLLVFSVCANIGMILTYRRNVEDIHVFFKILEEKDKRRKNLKPKN